MSLLDWFETRKKEVQSPVPQPQQQREIAEGLWTKCRGCGTLHYTKDWEINQQVCSSCGYHAMVGCRQRIEQLMDPDTWEPLDELVCSLDPLQFTDLRPYSERIRKSLQSTGLTDAVLTGVGRVLGKPLALAVMDFSFMGGSMGSVVGEKIARLTEIATQRSLPLAIFTASGGARMQEGVLSLMQMAKTSAALERHRSARQLYIAVLTHPTTGGVTASYAMLGDVTLAEPGAMIGFTGPRIIEQTLKQKLPEGFQTAEYLMEHGFVDMVVQRAKLPATLVRLLSLHGY
nr:acetyl-CoA carboxylase, carboxyltransferase subunit beta [Candidatus Cyanaurora vandensis]